MTFSVCKKIGAVILGAVLLIFSQVVPAAEDSNDGYQYRDRCPSGDTTNVPGGKIYNEDYWNKGLLAWIDEWGFAQCNCTSYVSDKLNQYGISFTNMYRDAAWSDAGTWGNAAQSISGDKIIVDNYPIPGDVAYWNKSSKLPHGHVAWVESVKYDVSGNPLSVNISEYNWSNAYSYGTRPISASDTTKYPTGFIHVVAYNEAITHLHYLDCYEMGTICENQTPQEWARIADKVYNNYLCKNCSGQNVAVVNERINGGFGGLPTGTAPQPIVGNRTDFTPDFDVFNESGSEVSSSCNNCSTKSLNPNQKIRTRLTAQTINANADGYKRSSSSNSIEGPIWWKIEGKTNWTLLTSEEYTISSLDKGTERDKFYDWIVPNYVGDILAMKACVDGDDEIYEEGEGARIKITNPDQSGTSNNCSRTERFFIVPPPPVQCQPPLINDPADNQKCINPPPVHCEPPLVNDPLDDQKCITSAAIIIPIITELLLSDPELTVKVQGNGKVVSIPKGINCPTACSKIMEKQGITLTAKPKIGNVFTGWKGACSATRKEPTCKLRVINDRTITATFAKSPQ